MKKKYYWEKLGRIFNPEILKSRALSAALMPMVEVLDEETELIRVYYAPRDEKSRSEIHFFSYCY